MKAQQKQVRSPRWTRCTPKPTSRSSQRPAKALPTACPASDQDAATPRATSPSTTPMPASPSPRSSPHASSELARSRCRWATPGGTYQESYLSPRRLIFTDRQVSFLCNTMHRAEGVRTLQALPEHEGGADTDCFLVMVPRAAGFNRAAATGPWATLKRWQLADYTGGR
ncbi:hypothetical protein VTI74DRAFT_2951 [Chaetomium olivicolor]